MRNLRLQHSFRVCNELLKDVKAMCCDEESGKVYFADCKGIYYLEDDSSQVFSIPFNSDNKIRDCDIVGMEHSSNWPVIFVAFSVGTVWVYNFVEKIENVTNLGRCIRYATFGVNNGNLYILTDDDKLVMISLEDPEVEVERNLQSSEYGEKSLVSVGWGSKETQFHGSEGKGAAKVKPAPIQPAVEWDDRKPRISWKRDSEYFVTSVIDKEHGCRKLHIWNQQCVLQCTSEVKNGLEQPLCWRPSGNLITCTQQAPDKHKVIFFEKNGLQHGEFDLPYPPNSFAVKEVTWNYDSTVLAVWGHELNVKNPSYSITLWTSKNYHWYQKQTLCFNSTITIKTVMWDYGNPLLLHVLCSDGQYLQYTWTSTYCRSCGDPADDNSYVAVIDGNKALVTPFKQMIVPPPMCAYYLQCTCAINDIVFRPNGDLFLILSDGRIAFCSTKFLDDYKTSSSSLECKLVWDAGHGNGFRKIICPHYCVNMFSVNWEHEESISLYPLSLNHWTWLDGQLMCIGFHSESGKSLILGVEYTHSSLGVENGRCLHSIDGQVIGFGSYEGEGCWILKNGEFYDSLCELSKPSTERVPKLVFSSNCIEFSPWIITRKQKMGRDVSKSTIIFWMNDKSLLHFNDVAVSKPCTSFYQRNDYLLATTWDNYLVCYSKGVTFSTTDSSCSLEEKVKGIQAVEEGARIVTSIPNDTKVILQMPRGNLEVIHPRLLVLDAIGGKLAKSEFRDAFDLAKKHRIDLKILHSGPHRDFLSSVGCFVEQLSSTANINLYLASLKENSKENSLETQSWHDEICRAIRKAIISIDKEKYFLSLVATYVQESEPKLEEALNVIRDYKGENKEKVIDESLKLLAYLGDVHDLYNVALSSYNFDIAIMVAERSNMDPKEYMPFLNELQALEENYRKFKINMHLKNYIKALENISKCKDHFSECMELIEEHKLFTVGLTVFEPSSEEYKIIQERYGDYLMGKGHHDEAGLMYLASGNLEKALTAFRCCANFRLAVPVAVQIGYSEDQISKMCLDIARKLKADSKYLEAAYLLSHFCKDFKGSIKMYMAGNHWLYAYRTIMLANELDMINSDLLPAMLLDVEKMLTEMREVRRGIQKDTGRLKVVREVKSKEIYLEGLNPEQSMCDSSSEMDSISSAETSSVESSQTDWSKFSLKTKISRKKRSRKGKKYELVEGSPHEDLAIMMQLKDRIARIDCMKDDFSDYLTVLLLLNQLSHARELAESMQNTIETIDTSIPLVWPLRKEIESICLGKEGLLDAARPSGSSATSNAIAETMKQDQERRERLCKVIAESCDEVPPPTWRKVEGMFLNCLNLPKNFRSRCTVDEAKE